MGRLDYFPTVPLFPPSNNIIVTSNSERKLAFKFRCLTYGERRIMYEEIFFFDEFSEISPMIRFFFLFIYCRVAARDERVVCTVLEVTQSRSNLISLRSLVLSRRSITWNQNRLTVYPSRCLHRLITRSQRVIQSRPCYNAFAYLLKGVEITVWPHYCPTRGIASVIFGERFTFIWIVSYTHI